MSGNHSKMVGWESFRAIVGDLVSTETGLIVAIAHYFLLQSGFALESLNQGDGNAVDIQTNVPQEWLANNTDFSTRYFWNSTRVQFSAHVDDGRVVIVILNFRTSVCANITIPVSIIQSTIGTLNQIIPDVESMLSQIQELIEKVVEQQPSTSQMNVQTNGQKMNRNRKSDSGDTDTTTSSSSISSLSGLSSSKSLNTPPVDDPYNPANMRFSTSTDESPTQQSPKWENDRYSKRHRNHSLRIKVLIKSLNNVSVTKNS